MITMEQALKAREELLSILDEDAHNRERILEKFDTIKYEKGVSPYSALFLILTHLPFEENEARQHWEALLRHREEISAKAGRDIGLRVALFDYFINLNKKIVEPKIIELSIFERIDRTSFTDMLTGLPNNRSFLNALSTELMRCKRYNLKCSVLILDLDDFGRVNDEHGSLVGDILLKEASALIRKSVRDTDTAYRCGGEEFSIIFPETLRIGAYVVSGRLREAFEKHFRARKVSGSPIHLTVSGGISLFPEDGITIDEIITGARRALYQAKARGKNTINAYYLDRRNFIRSDLMNEEFRVEIIDEETSGIKEWKARWIPEPRNISKSGILLKSEKLFPVGQSLEITFLENERNEIFTLPGRVVRVEELGGSDAGKFEIGVAFIIERENQEQKLIELIENFGNRSSKPR